MNNYKFSKDINLSESMIVVVIAAILIILVAVLLIIKRTKKPAQVKTGFLGKPLLQFVLVFIMVSAVVGGIYLNNQKDTDITSEATKEVSLEIESNVIESTSTKVEVELRLVPMIDSTLWGSDTTNRYDIIWNITNTKTGERYEFVERNKNAANTSSYIIELAKVKHDITAMILIDNTLHKAEISLDFSR